MKGLMILVAVVALTCFAFWAGALGGEYEAHARTWCDGRAETVDLSQTACHDAYTRERAK